MTAAQLSGRISLYWSRIPESAAEACEQPIPKISKNLRKFSKFFKKPLRGGFPAGHSPLQPLSALISELLQPIDRLRVIK